MRLIDADALLAEYDRVHVGAPGGARKLIEDAPTIDAAPVRHGRWGVAEIVGYDGYHAVYAYPCNKCCEYTREHKPRFCPNCGAKMDGGAEC